GRHKDLLERLAPHVRIVLPEEEIDPEDIPYADRVILYENSDGEQVEVTVPIASPPHRRSYDVVPEHYAAAPRARVRRWMLAIDSLKRHCAKLTQKLTGWDREERRRGRRGSVDREPQAETSRGQEGPSLGLGTSTHQRHSDVDRGVVPFVYVDPIRHSVGGQGSSMPFVPPPGTFFRARSSQPWSADSWAYWQEMDRVRQAQIFEARRQFMAMPQPYQYPSPQQGTYCSPGTLRILEQEPGTLGTELDRDLECYRSGKRNKEPVVDITTDDDSD
ncbi:hypothetical protein SOVF_202820 isoform A, partial [Spinacia oleracea]